jgi:hypothetical protein
VQALDAARQAGDMFAENGLRPTDSRHNSLIGVVLGQVVGSRVVIWGNPAICQRSKYTSHSMSGMVRRRRALLWAWMALMQLSVFAPWTTAIPTMAAADSPSLSQVPPSGPCVNCEDCPAQDCATLACPMAGSLAALPMSMPFRLAVCAHGPVATTDPLAPASFLEAPLHPPPIC